VKTLVVFVECVRVTPGPTVQQGDQDSLGPLGQLAVLVQQAHKAKPVLADQLDFQVSYS